MKKVLSLFITVLMVIPSLAGALEIKEGQSLTLEQCVEIALERHPDLKSAKATIEVKESGVVQAETAWNPEVDLSSSYRRRSVTNDGYNSYSNSVTVSQLITDWGKTKSQVAVAGLDLEASGYDYDDKVQNLLFDVKEAYFDLLRAMKEEEVALEAMKMYEHHLEQARAYYEVGKVSKIDVTTAEVNLSKAGRDLIKARTSVRTGRAVLNNALGYRDAPPFSIEDMLSWEKIDLTREDVLKSAMMTRPDLRSLEIQEKQAQESVILAEKSNLPSLSAKAGYSWGDENFTGNDELYVGISFEVSIYDGGLTKEKVRQARAELDRSSADLESLKQDVVLEVDKAFLELQDSAEAIQTAEKTVYQARENLDLANGRYEVGVGSPVEVTDATENYINARNTYYGSLYDYRSALAALEKAIGGILK